VYHNAVRGFWALSRFEDVRAASRDWRTFSNASGFDLDELGTLVFGPGDFLDSLARLRIAVDETSPG
jgi:hypothetical protein